MRLIPVALCTAITVALAAQGSEQGFKWLGIRAGSLSFDPQEKLKAASFSGGQVGMVFDQQRYGLSLEGLTSHPVSSLDPTSTLNHREVSVTLMTGLSESPGRFWPYFGLGLGGYTVAKTPSSPQTTATSLSSAVHASFGFLHRPTGPLIWGVEGRYLVVFSNPGMNAYQGSVMLGFSWGGRPSTPPPKPAAPPPPPPPPAPLPVVEVMPPPVPVPVPLPMVTTPPVVVPVPMAAAPPVAPAPVPPPVPVVAAAPIPVPAPKAIVVSPTSDDAELTARLDALLLLDAGKAINLGRKHLATLPTSHWTIRLEIANLPVTLKNAVLAFPGRKPDLFIMPITLKGGQTAYQLFLGDYASKAEAEKAAKGVPGFFLEGGQRPKTFPVNGLPSRWNQ